MSNLKNEFMQEYLTISELEKIIRDNNYPIFKLFTKCLALAEPFKVIKYHCPDSLSNLKTTENPDEAPPVLKKGDKKSAPPKGTITPEMIDESIEILHNNLHIYKNREGYLFKIECRQSATGQMFGPFYFNLAAIIPENNQKGLNGNSLPEFKSSDEYIDFRIKKAIFDRDVKEFYVKRAELDEDTRDFEEKKLNPAAQVAARGALYAWDVFSKHVLNIDSSLSGIPVKDDDKPADGTGETEDEDTEAASSLANELISSELTADEIKEIHRIVRNNLIPKIKERANKEAETD